MQKPTKTLRSLSNANTFIQMCFTRNRSMDEIGHQYIQAPLAAAISPLASQPGF